MFECLVLNNGRMVQSIPSFVLVIPADNANFVIKENEIISKETSKVLY